MSPIKPKGRAVPPLPSTKLDDTDQTIAEPPRDFTDEIFQQLTGAPAPPPAAGAPPPPPAEAPPTLADLEAPRVFNTQPMYNAPRAQPAPSAQNAPSAYPAPQAGAAIVYGHAPQSVPDPRGAQESNPRPEVRVRTPLWAVIYLAIALLAIAFGLFVLFMQSRVVGHF